MRQPKSQLEKDLFDSITKNTPEYIKNSKLLDLTNDNEFIFKLKKEHLDAYDEKSNTEGLNLNNWLKNYAKEAEVSTAGIRGPQNIIWPNDVRFPINLIGIMLATYAKALVANENYPDKKLLKIAGREVRYNSELFLDLIARIQAAQGIETLTPIERQTIPIWMASFLAFKLDLLGGEYITSSHGISVKNATKDLNSQGSQYLPEESLEFVQKIKDIFKEVEEKGYYDIKIASANDKLINEIYMKEINDGITLYKEYLQMGVAKESNINAIKNLQNKIIIENVGGCAYKTLSKLLEELGIAEKYDWFNKEEDPFFHGIGKYDHDNKGNKGFYDYSVDATVTSADKNGEKFFPVIESLNYEQKLKDYPISTAVFITDPDHDRLTICQVEDAKNKESLQKNGIDFKDLGNSKILSIFTANQAFLLIMDFWAKQLKESGLWNNHPRFIIKTTASTLSWDEWAKANDVKVINVPVGFKEIANIMKIVESQLTANPEKEVMVTDIYGNYVNLGVNPRMLFAGEESGGMIIGPEELIISKAGRKAIAMREKSATEAIMIASALVSDLEKQGKTLSETLFELFEKNNITARFDIREDISYYNESEPDIQKLTESKKIGEDKRTKNDMFFLTIALAKNQDLITLETVKEILSYTFKDLDFSNLIDIKFVGDGTYMKFTNKFIEIRPSGTDAKTKAYGAGLNKEDIVNFAQTLGNYPGDLNEKYLAFINKDYYNNSKETCLEICKSFAEKQPKNEKFVVPDYSKTLGLR